MFYISNLTKLQLQLIQPTFWVLPLYKWPILKSADFCYWCSLWLADVDSPCPLSPSVYETPYSDPIQLSEETLQTSDQLTVEYERSPIQNAPWKESNLDQPYQKAAKPQSASSSRSR